MSDKQAFFCLGKLEGELWSCASRDPKASTKKVMEFDIFYDGIYAIIFNPEIDEAHFREEIFCGILCKDKRLVFIFVLVVLPVLILLFFVFYKMFDKKLLAEIEGIKCDDRNAFFKEQNAGNGKRADRLCRANSAGKN